VWNAQDESDKSILFMRSQPGSGPSTPGSEDWVNLDMPMTEGVDGEEPLVKKSSADTGNGARDRSGGQGGGVGGGYPFMVKMALRMKK